MLDARLSPFSIFQVFSSFRRTEFYGIPVSAVAPKHASALYVYYHHTRAHTHTHVRARLRLIVITDDVYRRVVSTHQSFSMQHPVTTTTQCTTDPRSNSALETLLFTYLLTQVSQERLAGSLSVIAHLVSTLISVTCVTAMLSQLKRVLFSSVLVSVCLSVCLCASVHVIILTRTWCNLV